MKTRLFLSSHPEGLSACRARSPATLPFCGLSSVLRFSAFSFHSQSDLPAVFIAEFEQFLAVNLCAGLFRNGKSDRVFILLDEFDAFIFSVYLHLSNRKQPFNLFRVAAEPVDDFILKLIFSSIVAIDLNRLYMSIFCLPSCI